MSISTPSSRAEQEAALVARTSLLIFAACSVLMTTATTVPELFISRALAGIGIGAETSLIAPYISEFLPARVRGTFVSRTIGYLLAGLVAPGPRTSGRSLNEHMPATH
ncbi:hypothetical protein BN12_100030 [Nostocoides japonicum T1-X7]|uniref:Major facilitator superfamily (MFS) profile domain-containing protein n=1 Tax=Nostocoides japonicum T1-X7 TaxID=1194083 RepID=A0A077LSX6_9MICO|nr:MFS transporter [Tetrasphaera japonica]CCH76001.1 hypothetical protein BN12_100030 [Tetrasphaera japonica T1-X7]